MKATGIVRRIDDLGRVVIPKELRRTYHINEGDPLEIFVDDNQLVLKKYEGDKPKCVNVNCGSTDQLLEVDGIHICRICATKVISKFAEE